LRLPSNIIHYCHLGVKLIVVAVENLVVLLLLLFIIYYCEYTKHVNAFGHIVLFKRVNYKYTNRKIIIK